jgi:hypothetical protein
MPRVRIGPVPPDPKTIDVEIARLRDLDVSALRARWHTAFGRRPSPHLPRHLLFRVLAYRLQAVISGIWIVRADGCLMVRDHPRTPVSAQRT